MDSVPMSRIFNLLLWFAFGFGLAAAPMFAFAAIVPVPVPGVSTNAAGLLIHTSGAGITSVVYPALQTTTPLSVSLPPVAGMVQPGKQLMVIPTTITPNVARTAGAVVALARLSGPIGLGLTLLPILCTETKICQSSTSPNEFEIPVLNGGLYKSDGSATTYDSPDAVCASLGAPYGGVTHYVNTGPIYNLPDTRANASINPVQVIGKCVNSVGNYSGVLYKNGTGTLVNLPPTDGDFNQAVIKLTAAISRMGDIVSGLQGLGQPVPIDKPVLSPVSSTSPSTSTVNRDGTGAVTSTTTISTTTNVSPVTNTNTSNTVSVTQITNTTTTNNLGETTSSSHTTAEPPEPEDPEIEFDTVDDVPLEEQELPLSMPSATSWGEGSCPPDPSVSVLGHPIAIPVHVVCDYMSGVRMAVIAFFALISAYIVIGVKFEG